MQVILSQTNYINDAQHSARNSGKLRKQCLSTMGGYIGRFAAAVRPPPQSREPLAGATSLRAAVVPEVTTSERFSCMFCCLAEDCVRLGIFYLPQFQPFTHPLGTSFPSLHSNAFKNMVFPWCQPVVVAARGAAPLSLPGAV